MSRESTEIRETIKDHKDLKIYQMAFDAAMQIFELSKKFPVEERYSLTDQIRRSSRSVCTNLAEAWRNKKAEGEEMQRRQGEIVQEDLSSVFLPLLPNID